MKRPDHGRNSRRCRRRAGWLPRAALVAALPLSVAAQDIIVDDDAPPLGADRVAEALAAGAGQSVEPSEAEFAYLDDEGRAAVAASLTAYFRYRQTGYEHRRAVFDWQLLSSKVIFGVVIALVAVGVYFSWLQFMAASTRPRPRKAKAGEGGPAPGAEAGFGFDTSIEASPTGIKISSPVLGVVILVISLAFFYLYLVHIYPVSEIFSVASTAVQPASATRASPARISPPARSKRR